MALPIADGPVLLLGANGQVGTELRIMLEHQCQLYAYTRAEADLSQPETLREIVASVQPAVILNAAAYTAVDKAETEPELATLINAAAPGVLAQEAAGLGALLVHYSTDYVFDGTKHAPWIEDDTTAPLNMYGRTKLAGERAIEAAGGRSLIFRTSWVFAPHGKNFLLTMLRLAREREQLTVVADQRGAPTSAHAIAQATLQVIEKLSGKDKDADVAWSGVYHMSCADETTWYGFVQAILEEAAGLDLLDDKMPQLTPIPSSAYPTPARRPANSLLDNNKLLRIFDVSLPHWREALRQTMAELSLRKASLTH
jgi:dTDP-4-dehydrorhamnose reductase